MLDVLIRNATIHSATSISYNGGNIHIQYPFRNTNYELEISSKGLELLNSIIYEFISPFEPRSASYSDALRASMFSDLQSQIFKFNDENGALGPSLNNPYSFRYGRRYRPKPVDVKWESNTLTILNPHPIHPNEASFSGVDYEIKINDRVYLVPSEALKNASMDIDELSTWVLNNEADNSNEVSSYLDG